MGDRAGEPRPTRESIFQDAARRMRAEFEDARHNVPHRGEAGGEGEAIVRQFLNSHLPGRFRATGGFIIDKTDQVSGHADVIVYDSLNCPVYRTSERGMIVPNDNVAAFVEVKFTLTTTLLDSAIDKIHEAKNLTKTAIPPNRKPPDQPEQINTYGIVFGFQSELGRETVIDRWHGRLTDKNPLHNSCNMVVILDRGVWVTVVGIPGHGAAPATLEGIPPMTPPGTRLGIAYLEYGDRTLDAMMRLLLAHLTFFRHRVDHPGFNFAALGQMPVKWIGTVREEGKVEYTSLGGLVLPATS